MIRFIPHRLLPALFIALMLTLVVVGAPEVFAQDEAPHTIVLEINQRAWIEAVVDGERLQYGILPAGSRATYSGRAVYVRIGNAGGVSVTIDGVERGVLGLNRQIVDVRVPSTAPVVGRPVPATATPVPPSEGTETPESSEATEVAETAQLPEVVARGSITERMTLRARNALSSSLFYSQTVLSYYGRPNVPVMGILGEFDLDALTERLESQARAYDEANGDALGVLPAYHLVYGMATWAPGDNGSYLGYLDEETVNAYIERAQAEGFIVILDVQIGALSLTEAISPALAYLEHENVHLAIDPEFAMVHTGQRSPGDPIGFVTAEQVNELQAYIADYLTEHDLKGPRVLLLHQFQDSMIQNKADLDWNVPQVELTLSVDGWGGPWGKVSKYNLLTEGVEGFISFKLFYRWDKPLMSESAALGEESIGNDTFMGPTPNFIIYQ